MTWKEQKRMWKDKMLLIVNLFVILFPITFVYVLLFYFAESTDNRVLKS